MLQGGRAAGIVEARTATKEELGLMMTGDLKNTAAEGEQNAE